LASTGEQGADDGEFGKPDSREQDSLQNHEDRAGTNSQLLLSLMDFVS